MIESGELDESLYTIDKFRFFDIIGYKPSPGQLEFHKSKARYKIIAAGTRFGKSMSAGNDTAPMLLKPDTQVWVVGPTYQLGEKEFRYVWDALIVKMQLGRYCKRKNNNVELGDMYIEFPWGSWIRVKSAEKPTNLLGEELDRIVLAEGSQIKSTVWTRYLRGRLVSRVGDLVCNCTPNEQDALVWPMWQKGQDPAYPEYASWQFATWDNPYIDREEIEDARKSLPPDEFEEQFAGRFQILGAKSWFNKQLIHGFLTFAHTLSPRIAEVRAHLTGDVYNPRVRYELENSNDGHLFIYNEYNRELHYVLGVDVADDETPQGDFSNIDVLCTDTGRQVATWNGTIDPGELAVVSGAIGYEYGKCPIGVEYNNMGSATNNELKKFYDGPIYRRVVLDGKGRNAQKKKKIGWFTSAKTKPIMINELRTGLEFGRIIPQHPATCIELLGFGKDKKTGKLQGLGTNHDDRVISLAITAMVRKQFPEATSSDPDIRHLLELYNNEAGARPRVGTQPLVEGDEDISNILDLY